MPPYRSLQVHTKSIDFCKATYVVEIADLPTALPGTAVVKNHYVGINAADVKITEGLDYDVPLSFTAGLEGLGYVVAVGSGVRDFKAGDAVGCISVSIALEQVGQMRPGEIVLVTAAAGGCGQFAVQLAKLAGNHVIGTTSSDEKGDVLKALGVDRVINYNKESIGDVLQREYPNGVDLLFDSVGGETLRTVVDNIALFSGRVVIFGIVSEYLPETAKSERYAVRDLAMALMKRSASARGFTIMNHPDPIAPHFERLFQLVAEGKLKPGVDKTEFKGLESIADAVEYLFARKNIGKLAIRLV